MLKTSSVKKILITLALIVVFLFMIYKEKKVITIGSGGPAGVYYPIAFSMCEIFNKYNKDKEVICEAKLSPGAAHNIDAVDNGDFDMGIAQYNLQQDAYLGSGSFFGNPHQNLRMLFNLHYEYLTIIVKKDSGINKFSDLKGKKVNVSNPGSGTRILIEQMMKKMGWSFDDFAKIYEEDGSHLNKVLCADNKADAAIYTIGHPNKAFDFILNKCNTKLISLSKSEIRNLVELDPKYYFAEAIPRKTYKSQRKDINTIAMQIVLFAYKNSDQEIINNFVHIISSHKDELMLEQPVLRKSFKMNSFNVPAISLEDL